MTQKQMYFYHIITCANIEDYIGKLQCYPIVHFENETCKEKCRRSDTSEATETRNDSTVGGREGEDTDSGEGRGDIPDELATSKKTNLPKLCPGNDGVIEFENKGELGIRFRNGKLRRFTRQGGSRDRIEHGNGGVEQISPVHVYKSSGEGDYSKVYNGPYKLVALHQGARRRHWHLIYISPNKQWGFNSRLGRIIRNEPYKTKSIDCLSCLRKYLYSGDGRQVLQDILSEEHIASCICAEHKCGMDSDTWWKTTIYETDCAEGGDPVLRSEIESPQEGIDGMVDSINETNDVETQVRNVGNQNPTKQNLIGWESNDECANGTNNDVSSRNSNIIVYLCNNGAFDEAEALALFARSPSGINFICSKSYHERIRTYLNIARVLVFQESIKQRFERAKTHFATNFETLMQNETQETVKQQFKTILQNNNIDLKQFFTDTYNHFNQKTQKRNNL